MIGLKQLQRLCDAHPSLPNSPFLRTYKGATWTVASNGAAVFFVPKPLTRFVSPQWPQAGKLGEILRYTWSRPTLVELRNLRKQLHAHKREAKLRQVPVSIKGQVFDAALLLRYLAPLRYETASLRVVRGKKGKPLMRIDAGGSIVLVMGMVTEASGKVKL